MTIHEDLDLIYEHWDLLTSEERRQLELVGVRQTKVAA